MPVPTPAVLLTVADLETYLRRSFSTKDEQTAQAAVDMAAALVVQRIGFDPSTAEFDGVPCAGEDITAAHGVALRIAAQWLTNPEDRQSYSGPDGLSYTASPQMLSKIMSDADRVVLEMVQLRYAPGFG